MLRDTVWEKLHKEMLVARISKPHASWPMHTICLPPPPPGVVAKKAPGKYGFIHNPYFPRDESVNDAIDQALCALSMLLMLWSE